MAELTPIPAEHRRLYHEALRAGLAEAERRGLELDALPFAAFHRALYQPMVELIVADTRRKVAEKIRAERTTGNLPDMLNRRWNHALNHAAGLADGSGNGDSTHDEETK